MDFGFLSELNYQGFLVGLGAFFMIGVFHPVVKKVEYHFGKQAWPFLFFPGVALAVLSVFLNHILISIFMGVLGFSLFWSTHELFKQHKRVLKGQAKKNPKRKYD
jgi:hypothetical protein